MSNVYRVGIEFFMAGGFRHALGAVIADMGGMLLIQNRINRALDEGGRRMAAISGIASTMFGVGILKGALHIETAAEKLVHAEAALSAGLPDATRAIDMQIARTTAYAEAGKNLNTTLSENVEHLHDLYNVVQDMGEASKLLPIFNKLSNAFSFVKDKGALGANADSKEIAAAARAFEQSGRTNPEALEKIATEYIKSVIGLRGRVSGSQLLRAVQTGGGARQGWSDDFLAQGIPSLINVMPSNAGNSLYNFYKNLYQGVSSSYAQARTQEQYWLHTEADEMRDPKTGKFQGFKSGTVFEAELAKSDPQMWALKYRDLLKSHGVDVNDQDTMIKIVSEISRGNKLLGGILEEYLLPKTAQQLYKERFQNIGRVSGDALGMMGENDPKAWRDKLAKQWENFEEAFGTALVQPFIENVLKPLTGAFRDMSQWALKNPESVKQIAEGIVELGAALIGGGAVAILAALGPAGWLTIGVIGLAEVFARTSPIFASHLEQLKNGLLSLNGPQIKDALIKIGIDIFAGIFNLVWDIGVHFVNDMKALPGRVGAAIDDAIGKIGDWFNNAMADLWKRIQSLNPFSRTSAPVGGAQPLLTPASWERGGAGNREQHIHLHVDGREMARVVTGQMADNMEMTRSAAFFDGWRGYADPGAQLITT